MGHLQKMNKEQRSSFIIHKINAKKEAMRGHNYQYYSEKLQQYMDDNGYKFYPEHGINYGGYEYVTRSELEAKEKVTFLRIVGYYARIICGYEQNQQRIKMFSIIYKKK